MPSCLPGHWEAGKGKASAGSVNLSLSLARPASRLHQDRRERSSQSTLSRRLAAGAGAGGVAVGPAAQALVLSWTGARRDPNAFSGCVATRLVVCRPACPDRDQALPREAPHALLPLKAHSGRPPSSGLLLLMRRSAGGAGQPCVRRLRQPPASRPGAPADTGRPPRSGLSLPVSLWAVSISLSLGLLACFLRLPALAELRTLCLRASRLPFGRSAARRPLAPPQLRRLGGLPRAFASAMSLPDSLSSGVPTAAARLGRSQPAAARPPALPARGAAAAGWLSVSLCGATLSPAAAGHARPGVRPGESLSLSLCELRGTPSVSDGDQLPSAPRGLRKPAGRPQPARPRPGPCTRCRRLPARAPPAAAAD